MSASGDKALFDWLQEQIVDTIYLDDGRIIDVRGNDLRKAVRKAMDTPLRPLSGPRDLNPSVKKDRFCNRVTH